MDTAISRGAGGCVVGWAREGQRESGRVAEGVRYMGIAQCSGGKGQGVFAQVRDEGGGKGWNIWGQKSWGNGMVMMMAGGGVPLPSDLAVHYQTPLCLPRPVTDAALFVTLPPLSTAPPSINSLSSYLNTQSHCATREECTHAQLWHSCHPHLWWSQNNYFSITAVITLP